MVKRTARAFWVIEPGVGEIRSETLPERRADDLLLRSLTSAISRGSECLVFGDRVPQSQYRTMRAPFQDGEFPGPVKYGYSSVAEVLEGPAPWPGRRVFCLFPHQDLYVVPQSAVVELPDRVPVARAALAANMETALNALWDAEPHRADHIAVIGAGVVGCLVARLLVRETKATVQLIDLDPERQTIAEALEVDFANPESARRDVDLVFHASGDPQGLAAALSLARFEGRILELSWYGDRPVTLPLGEDFHVKRLTLQSSQVGTVAPARRAEWSRQQRLAEALRLLDDPALDRLLTGASPFQALPDTMAWLAGRPAGVLCHRVTYD